MTTAAARYTALTSLRDPYLRRARDCAKLTIPALMPPEGSTGSTNLPTPFQSVGARGVNNLASKFVTTLLPSSGSFFRLSIDDFALEELTQQEGLRGQVEEGLGRMERAAMTDIEGSSLRTVSNEGFKQLIVAGNVLLNYPRDGGEPRMFRIDKYVVKRSPTGEVLEIIVREDVAPSGLPEDVRALLGEAQAGDKDPEKVVGRDEKCVQLYTYIRRTDKSYVAHQEIADKVIPGTRSVQPLDQCEWLALRFIRVDGEDYGRSYVEEYLGDLRALEGLEKAILRGAAAAAKVLFLVNPNGQTNQKVLSQAESGSVNPGVAADISVVQMNKYGDFRVALEKSQNLQDRLAFVFLLNSAIQRNGERVTAEEIRYMARELEDALGGIYSIMAQEFQRPLVGLVLAKLRRMRKLPALPKGVVRPVIVTGLEAQGRGQELERLRQFVGEIAQTFPQALSLLNPDEFVKRVGTALGIDLKGLVKSAQQVQQEQTAAAQAQMMQQLVEKGAGPAISAISKNPQALQQGATA